MFSRLRNLFAKAKTENSPEPEPENGYAQTNGVNEQTKLGNDIVGKTGNISEMNTVITSENNIKEEEAEKVQRNDSATKVVELSKITPQIVSHSNGNVAQVLSTVTLENALTETTESTWDACDNKNKTKESINTTIETEKTGGEDVKASDCEVADKVDSKEQKRVEENAPRNGGEVAELVKVDTAHIEVNTQSDEEVVEKSNANENNGNGSESAEILQVVGEVAQNKSESREILENSFVSPITLNNNISNTTQAEATTATKTTKIENENSLEHIKQSTNLANVNVESKIPYSITVDELATDTSSPAVDRLTQSSSSPAGTVDSESTADSNTIVVKPTGNNDIACTAISNKLQEIAEVAESLDAAIRDVQQDAEAMEGQTSPSTAEKKREAMRSNSSEDWHSRSTEDDSFVTASEGNFTPHSHSSSYQTASGRTSSYISSLKSSFDVSEADDSAFASTYDIPVDINMSYDGSEHSFVSAQQQPEATTTPSPHEREEHAEHEESCEGGAYALPTTTIAANHEGDEGSSSSIADIEELHSQSVTPTPGDGDVEQYHCQSIPVESETEEMGSSSFGIVDSPSLQVLTEAVPVTSVTPEVSTCSCTDQQQQQLSLAQQQQPHANNNNTNTNNNNISNTNSTTTTTTIANNNQKPNAAWRRSKYYENITKQTIKGFL